MHRAGPTEQVQAAGRVPFALALDRAAPASLTEQISTGLRSAIEEGTLAPGARLPSWRAPAPLLQQAVAEFLQGGHQLRHLRRMKSLYMRRRDALCACLQAEGVMHRAAGLAVLVRVPDGRSDQAVAHAARAQGLAPVPLSLWYAQQARHTGLLLGVTNAREEQVAAHWARLAALIQREAAPAVDPPCAGWR